MRLFLAGLLCFVSWARAESVLTMSGGASPLFSDGATVKAGSTWYFPSGATAGRDATGDVKAQALACFAKLKENIAQAGLTLADVVHVRGYLVPNADGSVDYAGWNAAWTETFGSAAMPHKPTRTSLAVPQLGAPAIKVEVEFVCATGTPGAALTPKAGEHLVKFGAPTARIAGGIGVPAGTSLYWSAGIVPGREGGADTKSQARTTLTKLQANLAALGLSFKDVVFLRCFVGPDKNKGGTFDLEGWNAAYDEFFNHPGQPHKPARTTVTSPGISENTLVEIELIVAAPQPPAHLTGAGALALKAYGEATAAISSGVEVAPDATLHFSSGTAGIKGADTKMQAFLALTSLKAQLAAQGMSFKDVVFLRAYLVPDATGAVDRKGWSEAYSMFFNNPGQPHKPARTTMPVHSLPAPEMKIEIDIIAAKR